MEMLEVSPASWWYTVWFRNLLLDPNDPEDQDYEWPACIIIEAQSCEQAIEWGNHLVRRYLRDNANEGFISSDVELYSKDSKIDDSQSPRIKYGYEASDDEIGW